MFQLVMTIFLANATLTYQFKEYYDQQTCVQKSIYVAKHFKPVKKYKKINAEVACVLAGDRKA